jgi:two-component system nitrogen regulation sensor histidine kinase NtrY
MIGRTLKTRLFLAFISFAFIPTCLMFVVSVFYINNSFDRWFANRTEETIRRSSDLADQYVSDVREDSFYIANEISKDLKNRENAELPDLLKSKMDIYGVDALEIYKIDGLERFEEIYKEKQGFYLPPLSWDEVKKHLEAGKIKSTSRKTEQGEWLSSITVNTDRGLVLVVSEVLPFTLLDTMEAIGLARSDFQSSKEFKLPLKTTYLFILVTMTLVILAFGGWFSLYLAQSLSKSLFALGHATKRISRGDFNPIRFKTGMDEINELVENFNLMTEQLKSTRANLNESINDLNQHSIYMNTLLSQISSGVISCDNEFKITLINKRTQSLFDVNESEVVGKKLDSIFPPEINDLVRAFVGDSDAVQVHEVDVVLEKGSVLPLQVSIATLHGIDSEQIGYIITLEKVELLRENQRVKAWKEVATRVAHEIKNPLTPVKLSAERLQRKFGGQIDDPAFEDCTRTIVSHVDLIRDLVNEFNQFARFPKLKPVAVDFSDFILELVSTYKPSHPDVVFDVGVSKMDPVFLDRDQIKRVFINLIENSLEAMKKTDKKVIYIDAAYSPSGKVIVIKFYDSGPGIPQDKWSEVFKTKYTTKANSDGLGLAIVKKIIEDHGGRISILKGKMSPSVFLIEMSADLVVKSSPEEGL